MIKPFLQIDGVTIYDKANPNKCLVKDVYLSIEKGSITGVVGESGSGKSLTMKTLMGILPENLSVSYDQLVFDGQSVENPSELPFAMIFQDPMTSLNPLRTIGFHLLEVIQKFDKSTPEDAKNKAIDMLKKVGITHPETRLSQYPFELSGGMRQRVMIAMALLAKPTVLIADEPTTALDVTIQLQILALLHQLKQEMDLTIIIVSHDFGVIASLCDAVLVMNHGQIVEQGTINDVFNHAQHPYTKRLMALANFEDNVSEYTVSNEKTELKLISPTHFVRVEVPYE